MKTTVGLYHEPVRKKPWLVCWWGPPDPESRKQKKHTKTFRYSREAKEFHALKLAELSASGGVDRTSRTVTLGRLIEEFRSARLATLSESSKSGYANTMDQMIDHFGADRDIRTIDRRNAETFMSTRRRLRGNGGEISSWTRKRHLINCRAVFGAAVAWGYLDRNPFSAANVRGSSPLKVRARSGPWHHIMPAEFDRLLAAVTEPRYRAAYWLMYGCGLRAGEVYNLTADCIDLERRRVHVVNRAATEDMPPFVVKADGQSVESKERSVPIPASAIADITTALQLSFQSNGFVVLSPARFKRVQANWRLCRDGQGWAEHGHRDWQNCDMLNNFLRNAKGHLRKAGVDLSAPLTLHTFRKSFAQNHANAGTPPRTLAKLLGNTVEVCLQFYNRVTDANEREAAATMDRLLQASVAGKVAESAG